MDYEANYYSVFNKASELQYSFQNSQPVKKPKGLAGRTEVSGEAIFDEIEDFRTRYVSEIQNYFSSIAEEQAKAQEEPKIDVIPQSPLSFGSAVAGVGGSTSGRTLREALLFSESSGDPLAARTNKDGRSYVGLAQIGEARIKDYNKATGSSIEQADLLQSVDIQNQVIDWHLADLTSRAQKLSEETGMDVSGLVAVGHLGGGVGMNKFARTKGKYNPSDELGTSLQDYYTKFKGMQ
jgi:hypothetical protein